ncbi:hypothetical protein BHE74_00050541 [Ensete ventricosum]|nr:hypothetical protein BHE74_00050541 [Ensete ventricosum]
MCSRRGEEVGRPACGYLKLRVGMWRGGGLPGEPAGGQRSEPSDGREFLGRDAHVRWRDLVVPMCARPPRRRTDNVRPF